MRQIQFSWKKMNRNAHLSPHLLEEEDSRCRKPCVRPACGQGKLPAMDAPPMHYRTGCAASPTRSLPGSGVRNPPGLQRAGSRDTSRRPLASSVTKPWYTSRTNSYMVSGAAMGQADKDVLKLGGSTKDFSHFGASSWDSKKPIMTARSSAGRSVALSYTSYADVEDPDQHAENISAQKSHKADLLFHFDEEAQHVLERIFEDKDKTFGFEEKKKKKKENGIVAMIKSAVDDLMMPPAMRPQWEKEQAAMKKERQEEDRIKKMQAERDWQRAGGLKVDDVDEDQTAAARLMQMKKSLGEGSGERVQFDPVPLHGHREQGRFGTEPQRNIDYVRKSKFRYEGGRFGGARDGQGIQKYNDDYIYEGEWLLNQREGFASMDYPDGSLYEGQFFQSKQHGFGVLKTMDGKTYKGAWELGKKHGFGEMPDRNKGLIYSGQWVAGKRHGLGIQLDLKTGKVFAGQWEFGLKNGKGVMKEHNVSMGAIRTQMEWAKGKLVQQEPFDNLKHGTEIGEAGEYSEEENKNHIFAVYISYGTDFFEQACVVGQQCGRHIILKKAPWTPN